MLIKIYKLYCYLFFFLTIFPTLHAVQGLPTFSFPVGITLVDFVVDPSVKPSGNVVRDKSSGFSTQSSSNDKPDWE